MEEGDLRVFIDGAVHYFEHSTGQAAELRSPYLIHHDEPLLYDFTGLIGISGSRRGNVYFTATRPLIQHLLMRLGESESGTEHCCDLVGEIANTLSGNVRRNLGQDFLISVPMVIAGRPERLLLNRDCRSFVIPIDWQRHQAALVVSLE